MPSHPGVRIKNSGPFSWRSKFPYLSLQRMKIRNLKISDLAPAAYNPRVSLSPDDPRYVAIAKSLDEWGLVQPLVFNRRTKTLVSGHQRLRVLQARGETHAECVVVDLPLAREKALCLALNKISGGWDKEKLSTLLDELVQIPELNLQVTGFELPEVEQLLQGVQSLDEDEEAFDVESALQDSSPAVTQPGDLIELGKHGEHRLLCGDATSVLDVRRVLGGKRVHLLHTDPPYGCSYDPSRRQNLPSKRGSPRSTPGAHRPPNRRLLNDDLSPARYAEWFARVSDQMTGCLRPGAPYYIWNGHRQFGLMSDLLVARGCHVASVLTWGKESAALSFGDYHEQTEFCLYGWRKGARHSWFGPKTETSLWSESRDNRRNYRHPTQKALALAERAIRNSSQPGDVVWDPFLGSGTTLIAAARLGRRGFGLELDAKYCDVIVRRYIALAGEKAVPSQVAARYRIPWKA